MWVWVADHDIDDPAARQVDVFAARGVLSESEEGPVWFIGAGAFLCPDAHLTPKQCDSNHFATRQRRNIMRCTSTTSSIQRTFTLVSLKLKL